MPAISSECVQLLRSLWRRQGLGISRETWRFEQRFITQEGDLDVADLLIQAMPEHTRLSFIAVRAVTDRMPILLENGAKVTRLVASARTTLAQSRRNLLNVLARYDRDAPIITDDILTHLTQLRNDLQIEREGARLQRSAVTVERNVPNNEMDSIARRALYGAFSILGFDRVTRGGVHDPIYLFCGPMDGAQVSIVSRFLSRVNSIIGKQEAFLRDFGDRQERLQEYAIVEAGGPGDEDEE